jgi:hypothetical protein
VLLILLGRRASLNDIHALNEKDLIPLERMRTDVELCGEFLELLDREAKMRHAITIAEASLFIPSTMPD